MRRRVRTRVLRHVGVGLIGLAVLAGVGLAAATQSAEAGRAAVRSDEATCLRAGFRYTGKTIQGKPICFTLTNDRTRLIEWAATVRPGCPGLTETIWQNTTSVPVSAGRFTVVIDDPPHLRLNLQGQISGSSASGTISAHLDEEGCGISSVRWSAWHGGATTPGPEAPTLKPPVISRHPDLRAEATRPQGARVAYRPAKVTGATSVKYSRPSGAWFRLGTTSVTIVAKNRPGTARATFKVTVVDTAAPVFGPLPAITVTATSAGGANVAYKVTVTHRVGPAFTACSPGSGSLFPIGTTTVACNTRDTAGNEATASFNVVVLPLPLPPGLVANGHYTGTTSQGKPVSFSATADGLHLTGFNIAASLTCSPDPGFGLTFTWTPSLLVSVAQSGSFDLSSNGTVAQSDLAGSWTAAMHGQFAATGFVSGTYQSHISLTMPGSYECDTGALTWSASRTG